MLFPIEATKNHGSLAWWQHRSTLLWCREVIRRFSVRANVCSIPELKDITYMIVKCENRLIENLL